MATPNPIPAASLSDILTAAKNIVTALNNAAQTYLSVNGILTTESITTPTVLKSSSGRVAAISVIVAGSATGTVYDSANTSTTTAPVYVIPNAVALTPYVVNMPVSKGILIVPGTGQTLSVSWS